MAGESAVMLLAAVPFYAAGAFLADAAVRDAVRVAACVAFLWPVAWCAGAWLADACARPWMLLAMLLAAMGLPAAHYIAVDFMPVAGLARFLGDLSPAVFAWKTASSRVDSWLPAPAWAWLAWPAAAALGALLRLVVRGGRARRTTPSSRSGSGGPTGALR